MNDRSDAFPEVEPALILAPHLRWVALSSETGFVLGGGQRYAVRGAAALEVMSLLDGVRTASDIVAAARVEQDAALRALSSLLAAGLLTSAASLEPSPAHVSLHACGGRTAQSAISRLDKALTAAGLCTSDSAALTILVCDDYSSQEVRNWCSAWRAEPSSDPARALLLIAPSSRPALLGPILAPGEGPCIACFQHALSRQRPLEASLRAFDVAIPVAEAPFAAGTDAAASLLAIAARRWFTEHQPAAHPLLGCVTVLDPVELKLTPHRIVRRPQCELCGTPGLMAAQGYAPPKLEPAAAALRDGGLREQSPEHTYARLAHLVSDRLGPVTFLTAVQGGSADIDADELPVFLSGFMAPVRTRAELERPGNPFDQVCAGKGLTSAQARMSALGEALERHAGVFQGDEAYFVTSYEQLRTDPLAAVRSAGRAPRALAGLLERQPGQVLHPNELQLFSADQLATRSLDTPAAARVPEPLPEDAFIAWTPVWSLATGGLGFAPLSYVYARTPEPLGSLHCIANSNGCAAGNSLAEAALQGLYELVERDAIGIWWYNRLRRPQVELDSVSLDHTQKGRLDRYRAGCLRQGFETWLLDLTSDLGVPVSAAIAHQRNTGQFCFGFGCHADPATSVTRAFSELAQLLRGERAGASPWAGITKAEPRWLFPCAEAPRVRAWRGFTDTTPGNAAEQLAACVTHLKGLNLEVFIADKSRPDVDLRVARVIVPGLRHAWPRFAPGRLYDVPVTLGYHRKSLREAELNPVPLLV